MTALENMVVELSPEMTAMLAVFVAIGHSIDPSGRALRLAAITMRQGLITADDEGWPIEPGVRGVFVRAAELLEAS